MRLYLVQDLQREAFRIWGSMKEIEDEKSKRIEREEARKRKIKPTLLGEFKDEHVGSEIIEQEVKRLREEVVASKPTPSSPKKNSLAKSKIPDVFTKRHEHVFGPEIDIGDGFVEVKCIDCGFKIQSEYL